MNPEASACSTARIAVTITEFREVGRGFSRADVALTDTGNGKVSQARVNDMIVVHKEVYLDFRISGVGDDRHSYLPIGISFQARHGRPSGNEVENQGACAGNPDLLGRAAFPMRTTVSKRDGAQLTVFDANPEPNEFKFSLVIQRSDGVLGVIDPAIGNRGTNMNA